MYIGHSRTVTYYTSSDSGATWGPVETVSTNETADVSNMDAIPFFVGNSSVVWAAGNTVRFQDPWATPSTPWSMPGVSPYESYFGNLEVHVSPGNGLLGVSQTDLYLPGKGMDLAITRVFSEPMVYTPTGPYGSLVPYQFDSYPNTGFIGEGWALDFPWLGTNSLHLYGGQAFPYAWKPGPPGTQVFNYHKEADFQLVQNVDSSYTLNLRDGRRYQFNSAKQLRSITDRANDVINFDWGWPCAFWNVVTQIRDTNNRAVTFNYDCLTDRIASINYGSRTWSYAYASASGFGGRISKVTDPLGKDTNFEYDSNTPWIMTRLSYPTGGYITFGYQTTTFSSGTLVKKLVNDQVYYVSAGVKAKEVSAGATGYSVSSVKGSVTKVTLTSSDQIGDKAKTFYQFLSDRMFVYEKDPQGNVIHKTTTNLDYLQRVKGVYVYGSNGNTVLGHALMTHDNWGNLEKYTDYITAGVANAVTTNYKYANTESGWPNNVCPSANLYQTNPVPSTVYDALVGVCTNLGSTLTNVQTYILYNSNGLPTQIKQMNKPNGLSQEVTLKTNFTYTGALLNSVTDLGTGHYVNFGYDANGVLVSRTGGPSYTRDPVTEFITGTTDQGGNVFTFTNDAAGRVRQIDEPGGYHVYISYPGNTVKIRDENGHNVTKVYDGLGRLTSVSGPINGESFTYNWMDEVITDTVPSGNPYTNSYDALGRLTKVTNPDTTYRTLAYSGTANIVTATDEKFNSVTYTYNWKNWLTSVSTYGASYTYDKLGRLKTSTLAGQATNYYYDNVGNLYKTLYPDLTTATAPSFDSAGNMKTRVSPNGTSTYYGYDNLNELNCISLVSSCGAPSLSIVYDGYGNVNSMSGTGFATVSRNYNWRGELTSETAGTLTSSFTYDGAGNLVGITYPGDASAMTLGYDNQNRLTSVGSYVTNIVYSNPGNNPTTFTLGNGGQLSFTYDSRDRLQGYGLDAVGNVGAVSPGYNGVTYTYNALNQLTGSSGGWLGATSYTYDTAGNLKTMTEGGVTTNLVYPSSNYMNKLSSTSVGGVTKFTYTYDNDGNMVTRNDVATSTLWKYTYNYLDQMTKVTKAGTTVETNVFDVSGRRITRTMGAVTTSYAYIGNRLLYEYNSTGTSVKHVYADGIQVAEVYSGVAYYPVQDYVSSTMQVKDSSQATVFSANYYPWGKVQVTLNTHPESLKFTTMPYDSATGLYFFGTRFYDPSIGRFVQQDSFAGRLSDPLSLNHYAYAGDNPMTFSDRSGMDWLPPWEWSASQWESFGIFAGSAVGAVVTTVVCGTCSLPLWGAAAGAGVGMSVHGGQRPDETFKGAAIGFAVGFAIMAAAEVGLGVIPTSIGTGGAVTGATVGAESVSQRAPGAYEDFIVNGQAFRLTKEAVFRLTNRQITFEDLRGALGRAPFDYVRGDKTYQGFFDPAAKTFAPTFGGNVITVYQGSGVFATVQRLGWQP